MAPSQIMRKYIKNPYGNFPHEIYVADNFGKPLVTVACEQKCECQALFLILIKLINTEH